MRIKVRSGGFSSGRNYEDWMIVKDGIQFKKVLRTFKEWEIWWCAVGENVGTEVNGKGDKFARPVIVLKKFNRFSFAAIPLTTKDHTGKFPDWHIHFRFQGKDEYAMINQIENMSVF
ncbi:type II toxin-antitoxin system PemK/MazF family toxin [Candidatus Saccharibacteria bacterium]|nr:type II toxin-antitoxin system PemK/MazF family toxin [Candidatus Saccharibacteria bacterium]MBQ6313588.1 type II toxin-antitoxin system PemK/MazF family toxin [Candidatus Saccharibacteria bacterium]